MSGFAKSRSSQTLKSEQVATILGVSKRTLKNWLKAGKVPEPRRNPANNYRIWTLADIDAIRNIMREEQYPE